jgi:hypothetical protein
MDIKLKNVELSNGETLGYRERIGGKDVLLPNSAEKASFL